MKLEGRLKLERRLKLEGRLKLVADKVPQCKMVCDVGTDHAFVPIYLIQNEICETAIAADVSEGPIMAASKNIKAARLEKRIETRLGSGMTVLEPGEADTVVIAGMGGELIVKLMEESEQVVSKVKTFIFQPMNLIEVLREWLYRNDFTIIDEEMVREKEKIYTVIEAVAGKSEIPPELYFEIGWKLVEKKDPLLPVVLERKLRQCKKVLEQLKLADNGLADDMKERIKKRMDFYEDILKKVYGG